MHTICTWTHQPTGRGGWGGCSSPCRKKNSIIRAKLMYRSDKDTVKNISLFNISIYLFSSRISPNLLTNLCTTSGDGCYYSEFCRGPGSDNQDRAGTGNAYELAAMLIYVRSRVHGACINLVDWSMSLSKSRKDPQWDKTDLAVSPLLTLKESM